MHLLHISFDSVALFLGIFLAVYLDACAMRAETRLFMQDGVDNG